MNFIFLAYVAVVLAVCIVTLNSFVRKVILDLEQDAIKRKIDQYVKAAEQQIRGAGRGFEKIDYVETLLEADGVDVTGQVRAMIEAAVYQMQIGG